MKKILVALVDVVILTAFLSQAFAREEGKLPPAYSTDYKKAFERYQTMDLPKKILSINKVDPEVIANLKEISNWCAPSEFYDVVISSKEEFGDLCPIGPNTDGGNIASFYGCKFNPDAFQKSLGNNGCPKNSTYAYECSDLGYTCISSNPFASMKCAPGYKLDHSWADIKTIWNGMECCKDPSGVTATSCSGYEWCNGYTCKKDLPPMPSVENPYVPTYVCNAKDSLLMGGGCGDFCCAFFKK